MRAMSEGMHTRTLKLAGSVALGLGLLTLGALGLVALGMALPAGDALAASSTRSRDRSTWEQRVEGETFHWSGRLSRGQTIEIRGINGGIEAEKASGNQVSVEGRKSARKSDPDDVQIEVIERGDGILICARYPRPDGTMNECDDREGQSTRNNDVVVKFKVRVPAGVNLVANTVNGAVSITGLESNVEANTVNGAIHVWTTGTAAANTVNGSVTARIGADLGDDLEFSTVNGRVLVEMPRHVNAVVSGSTVHGSIATDFPLTVKGRRYGNRRLNGTLGRGGHELRLATVNGSIELRSLDGSSSKRRPVVDDEDEEDEEDGDDDDSR